jgi:LCP family protein required for cell wall assembly
MKNRHIFRRGEEPTLYLDGDQPRLYRRKRVRWKRVLLWTSLAVVALLIVIALFAWGYIWNIWIKSKESQMRVAGVESALSQTKKGRPVTTLVMGVDRGSVKGEGGPGRSDIVMLVSVSSDGKKAAVISIPRDTRVVIPGYKGYYKINAAHAFGGTKQAVETVRAFTGLDINHFVEIDFNGFKHIVNAIGGVPMHIEKEINDKYAGKVPAGDVVLNGDQALALVRARYDVEAVPEGDLGRVKNQQKFLQAMLSTVSHQRNPFRIIKLVNATAENVKTDLTFGEMFSLGLKLRGIGTGKVQMTTAPGEPKVIGGVWYFVLDKNAFQQLLSTFKSRSEVEVVEEKKPETTGSMRSQISVAVLNGARVQGLATSVAKELEKRGYPDVARVNAESAYSKTTIYYSDEGSSKAGTVASDLEGAEEPLLKRNDDVTSEYEVDVVVVLGSDYRTD